MAVSNRDRVGKALELLSQGIKPFFEREMRGVHGDSWLREVAKSFDRPTGPQKTDPRLDTYALLKVMWDEWHQVFGKVLGFNVRTLVAELRDVRNKWAHEEPFSADDAYRALDSAQRLLQEISAGEEAAEIERQKNELLRVRYEEQARKVGKKAAKEPTSGLPAAGLKPWREIATPHDDVASGRYQEAEFAADLSQVFRGEAASEYQDPREFFRRTFITGGLHDLLTQAVARITGTGGNPVVGLQTNFGGGKTHSLLALHHLFSGVGPAELPGVDQLLKDSGVADLPEIKRAVLVGTAIGPAKIHEKADGIKLHTLWGELAWQLGGKEGYELVAEADADGVSPGSDDLVALFKKFTPCMILIDEWVAYARQLYEKHDLPAGTFDAHFSFAQSLTEAAKAVRGTLVVVSIPSSDREVGGVAGKEALDRLENVVHRADSPWRPASTEEGFEIVRRRLFQTIEASPDRDAVIKAFVKMYREQSQEFPQQEWGDYEDRLKASYPIHPELFDRLYQDWATIEDFQLTRGVLRLMAAVIHALWEEQDSSLLIMPGTVPVEHPDVHFHLMQYLEDVWAPVVETDIDGPNSLALRLDRNNPNLGRLSATRRVSRSIFVGSAPTVGQENRGIDDARIKLGCAQPGEPVAVFGDALRRLSDEATHLYLDKGRYWFDTKPTITKTANQRAAQFSSDEVEKEIVDRLRSDRERGDFAGVHVAPRSGSDVPDIDEARLVILGPEHPHSSNQDESPARFLASEILEERGAGPRRNRNMVVFLAPDRTRLADLNNAVRQFLAWQSVHHEQDDLNLDAFQRSQAKSKLEHADDVVKQRIPETLMWVLAPVQPQASSPVEWEQLKVQGQEPLALRVSRRLKGDEHLIPLVAATRLRHELDKVPLWQGDHVGVKQLWEYFCQYLYLPRLKDSSVLVSAIQDGVASTSWNPETFAYAEGTDEEGKYLGLKAGEHPSVMLDGHSLLVKPEIAAPLIGPAEPVGEGPGHPGTSDTGVVPGSTEVLPAEVVRRFHGVVDLDPMRINKDVAEIVQHVVEHLTGLAGAKVEVSLEIQADVEDGVPEEKVRTVTENARTLKFRDHGFEKE